MNFFIYLFTVVFINNCSTTSSFNFLALMAFELSSIESSGEPYM